MNCSAYILLNFENYKLNDAKNKYFNCKLVTENFSNDLHAIVKILDLWKFVICICIICYQTNRYKCNLININ